MRRWWQDTLFKRLFLLIWGCLVVSHFVAFFVVTRLAMPAPEGTGNPAAGHPPIPTLGTLPPTRRGEQGSLVVQPYNVTTVRVGAWPLNVSAVGVGQRFAVTLL